MSRFEPLLIPSGVPLRAEEVGAHVVIHAVNLPAQLTKIPDNFETNESGGTCDEEIDRENGGRKE